jgi:hypothetical protein
MCNGKIATNIIIYDKCFSKKFYFLVKIKVLHSGGDQVLPAGGSRATSVGSNGATGAGSSVLGTFGQGVETGGSTVLPTSRRGQCGGGGQGTLGGGYFHRDRFDDAGSHGPKINFPNYDGESDLLTWLNKCSTYFRGMGMAPEERVWMASLHLDNIPMMSRNKLQYKLKLQFSFQIHL